MKTKLWRGLLIVVAVMVVALWYLCMTHFWPHRSPAMVSTATNSVPLSVQHVEPVNNMVKVPTGAERMTNAVRCMAYIVNLADKLPADGKRGMLSIGGLLFFDDCLMSKIKDGHIRGVTTNQLWQCFSNGVVGVFGKNIPADLAAKMASPDEGNWTQNLHTISTHEKWFQEHPNAELVHGFATSLSQRNQFSEMTLDDQYRWLAQGVKAKTFQMVSNTIAAAGVIDPPQSDLKNMMLFFGMMRTEFARADCDAILHWRLVNMYGFNETQAQTLITNLPSVQENEFNPWDFQAPTAIK